MEIMKTASKDPIMEAAEAAIGAIAARLPLSETDLSFRRSSDERILAAEMALNLLKIRNGWTPFEREEGERRQRDREAEEKRKTSKP